MKCLHKLFLVFLSISFINFPAFAEDKVYKIAAGSILESYFSIGMQICNFMKEANKDVRCEVVPTSGSFESLELLRKKEVQFAFAQSNFVVDSYKAGGLFRNTTPNSELRQVLRLHDELFTILVKDKDKLMIFQDLDGKKISNGPPMSDSSATYALLKKHYQFIEEPKDVEISHEYYAKKFCAGNVDAILVMTGHPNALINHISHSCDTEFLMLEEKQLDKMLRNNKFFKKGTLKADMYPNISASHDTIAVESVFVTNDSIDKQLISDILKLLNSKIDIFRSSHPVLYDLSDDHFGTGFVIPSYSEVIREEVNSSH